MSKTYLVNEADLTAIADTIRNKTGYTDKLSFPDEFFTGIRDIETTPATTLPILDMNYPTDITIVQYSNVTASFNIIISEPGVPAFYTYQWYFNGVAVEDSNNSSFLKATDDLTAGTYNIYCEVTNDAGVVTSRTASLVVKSYLPSYTYSGNSTLVNDGNGNWRIKFLTSGTLKFTSLGSAADGIDVFCVGGGGAGANGTDGADTLSGVAGGGGGGGYTTTKKNIIIKTNTNYTITVGAGGTATRNHVSAGGNGGKTSAFNVTANGGQGGGAAGGSSTTRKGGDGGSGGGGGGGNRGNGGTNGGNGTAGSQGTYGTGQGTTTREFGETNGTLYSGGGGQTGGSGGGGSFEKSGTTNLGGGGGLGHKWGAGNGGSGIVVIRNARTSA